MYKGYKLSLKMVIRMTPSVIRTTWGAARHPDQYRYTGHQVHHLEARADAVLMGR